MNRAKEDLAPEALASVKRGLAQKGTIDRGSFADTETVATSEETKQALAPPEQPCTACDGKGQVAFNSSGSVPCPRCEGSKTERVAPPEQEEDEAHLLTPEEKGIPMKAAEWRKRLRIRPEWPPEFDALLRDFEAAEANLRNYGNHLPMCTFYNHAEDCNCGWDRVDAALAPQERGGEEKGDTDG
jgi:hypothetical protein